MYDQLYVENLISQVSKSVCPYNEKDEQHKYLTTYLQYFYF